MTTNEIIALFIIATLGHVMAGLWYLAFRNKWSICNARIYAIEISDKQLARELKNSIHTPLHAVILAAFLYLGFFATRDWTGFAMTLAIAFV